MPSEGTFESVLNNYLRGIEAGGDFDSIAFLEAHPEHREALREFMSMQQDFKEIVEPLRQQLVAELSLDSTTASHATETNSRFRKLRLHAEGGLGRIYLAMDTELNRTVALKEIKEEFANDPTSQSRFRREAEIPSGLEHPGIVPVFGRGISRDGRPYYAMRFVEGNTFKVAIKQFHSSKASFHSVEFRRLLNRFVEVCNAMAYAHSRGVLHRDLKPGNIMLGKFGETQIVDWGLAKHIAKKEEVEVTITNCANETASPKTSCDDGTLTNTGIAVGTLPYMSPEQADGRIHDLGPATDIYSLGATLYALLTGKIPFQEINNPLELLKKVKEGAFATPRQVKQDVPRILVAVALKAMAHKPQNRYPTAQELAKEIEQYLADESVGVLRDPVAVRIRRWMRKHPRTITGLAATVLVSLVGLGAKLYVVSAERDNTRRAYIQQCKTTSRSLVFVIFNRLHVGTDFATLEAIDSFHETNIRYHPDLLIEHNYYLFKPTPKTPEEYSSSDDQKVLFNFESDPQKHEEMQIDNENASFIYYSVFRAGESCVRCHSDKTKVSQQNARPSIKMNDIMAAVRISMPLRFDR